MILMKRASLLPPNKEYQMCVLCVEVKYTFKYDQNAIYTIPTNEFIYVPIFPVINNYC